MAAESQCTADLFSKFRLSKQLDEFEKFNSMQ